MSTWAAPSPKIARLSFHSFEGRISRPMMKQEHHHARLGGVQQRLGPREQVQPEGPDQQAGREITQHGAKPEPPKQRHRDPSDREQSNGVTQIETGYLSHRAFLSHGHGSHCGLTARIDFRRVTAAS